MIRALLLLAVFLVALSACQPKAIEPSASEKPEPLKTYFPLEIGKQAIEVQVAVTRSELSTGLMFRTGLDEDRGMLFVFPDADKRGFYMRNVDFPLDIGYISPDGVLREVYPMYPRDETSVLSRSSEIQFALEMNHKWFVEHGVRPGDRIDLSQVAAALEARGFDPRDFGISAE